MWCRTSRIGDGRGRCSMSPATGTSRSSSNFETKDRGGCDRAPEEPRPAVRARKPRPAVRARKPRPAVRARKPPRARDAATG